MILRACGHRLRRARRTAHARARAPRAHIALTKTRPRQHERMARAVRRRGPLRPVVPLRFEHDGVVRAAQAQRPAFIGKRARPRPEHAADSVHRLHIRRHRRDDEEALRRDARPGGERKIHIARNAPAREVFRPRVRVVELDEFHVPPVHARRGMRHDFRKNERRLFARNRQRLGRALPAIRIDHAHRRGGRSDAAIRVRHRHRVAARVGQRGVCDEQSRCSRAADGHSIQRPLIRRRRRAVRDHTQHRAVAKPQRLRLGRDRDEGRRERIADERDGEVIEPRIREAAGVDGVRAIVQADFHEARRIFPSHVPRPEIEGAAARDRHHRACDDRRNRLVNRQRHRPVRRINVRALERQRPAAGHDHIVRVSGPPAIAAH